VADLLVQRNRRGGKRVHRCSPPGPWRRWRGNIGIGSVWQCECGRTWAYVVISAGVDAGQTTWVWPVPSWAEYYPGLNEEALAEVRSHSPFEDTGRHA
jgi:hypothetical protein